MRVGSFAAGLVAASLLAVPVLAPQSRYGPGRGGEDETGPYDTAEVFNGRAQKFRPRQGIDRARLVGQPLRNQRP